MSPTTSTTTKQLAQIEKECDDAQAAAVAARDRMRAWDAETEALKGELYLRRHSHRPEFTGEQYEPKPNTQAGKLAEAIRKRLREPNPEEAAYGEARAKFHRLDEHRRQWKVAHAEERMAAVAEDHPELVAEFREAVDVALGKVNTMLERADQARVVAQSTPGVERHPNTWGHDPRLHEWRLTLEAISEGEVIPPCFSPIGQSLLDEQVKREELSRG